MASIRGIYSIQWDTKDTVGYRQADTRKIQAKEMMRDSKKCMPGEGLAATHKQPLTTSPVSKRADSRGEQPVSTIYCYIYIVAHRPHRRLHAAPHSCERMPRTPHAATKSNYVCKILLSLESSRAAHEQSIVNQSIKSKHKHKATHGYEKVISQHLATEGSKPCVREADSSATSQGVANPASRSDAGLAG